MKHKTPIKTDPRVEAIAIIGRVHEGRALTPLLEKSSPIVKQLCYGYFRWQPQLLYLGHQLLHKPLRSKDQDVFYLLLLGIYQLQHMNDAPPVLVNATVQCASYINKPWAKALLNKLLHRFINEQDDLTTSMSAYPNAHFAHPKWMIRQLKQAWPNHWQAILNANNQKGPLYLRVNAQKITRSAYLSQLIQADITAQPPEQFCQAIEITPPVAVAQLPGFFDGLCSVQDLAGQTAAQLMDVQPKQRLLDACAAPGSKTCHLFEIEPTLQITAVDCVADRMQRLISNIQRLQLPVEQLQAHVCDVLDLDAWWDHQPFDRILLDAPCSGLGVIRRHPDIKILRQATDIPAHAALQLQMLTALWPLLKMNGKLLYSTCSVLPAENEHVVADFLAQHHDAQAIALSLPDGLAQQHGWQRFPQPCGPDGFYYSLLQKTAP